MDLRRFQTKNSEKNVRTLALLFFVKENDNSLVEPTPHQRQQGSFAPNQERVTDIVVHDRLLIIF